MKKLLKSLALFFIILSVLPTKLYAITLLQDTFSGTTINTAKWIEYDSASRVNQNNGLTMTGNNNWTQNTLVSQDSFSRADSLTLISTVRVTGALGHHMALGYGDHTWLTSGNSAYFVYLQGDGSIAFQCYDNGGLRQTWSAGTYTLGTTYTFKIVVKTTGADLYIDSGSGYPGTPNASIDFGTFTNKKMLIEAWSTNSTLNVSSIEVSNSALPPSATSYTLLGPTTGVKDHAETFTVEPNGAYTGTITPHSTGSGTFSPTSLSWSGTSEQKSFTYTPTSVAGSPHTISTTSSPSLTDPSSISFAVTPDYSYIAVNDPGIYWSRDNVYVNGSSYALMLVMGSYFKTNFTGTMFKMSVDVSPFVNTSVASARYPVVRYKVDGGAWTTTQLTPSTTDITISGLSAGTHSFHLEFSSGAPFSATDGLIDKWANPIYAIKITGFTLDEDSAVSTPTTSSTLIRFDGDSITEGLRAIDATDAVSGNSAVLAFPYLIAQSMGAEHVQLGYGGQGYSTNGSGNVPNYPSAAGYYYSNISRLVSGALRESPDVWVIAQGTNDNTAQITTAVQNRLVQARVEAGADTKIIVVIPFSGTERTNITNGYNAYIAANPSDTNTHLVDLGVGFSFTTTDGIHPDVTGHQTIATALGARISAILDTTAPTVSVTAPTDNAVVSGSISISATASDNQSVAGVQFKLDGTNIGSEDTTAPYSISWDSSSVADGAHTITATARDTSDNTQTSTGIDITVDNTGPTVSITSPTNNATVSGTITVTASASDNQSVAGVQFKIDGSNTGSEDTTAPYSISLDTAGFANGTYTLVAHARDTSDNTQDSTTITITIDNTPQQTPQGSIKTSSSSVVMQNVSRTTPPLIRSPFVRNLTKGISGEDVKNLQKILNQKGYPVAIKGPGSPGNETMFFGPATRAALAKFQKANNIFPALGYFGPKTRAFINTSL